ncbi:TetR family transcriptional regulator [Burkholderia sp. PAMC 28687]|uniref:TetR/AcrR family transcriptional regulator n=1 Tax=Burkholderia sp. PAMC 28687 TaxID=1795874 RepID=UPI00078039D4|nr:TetR/AcrR family transcriptional regulator [Burkholderia sp. PAMC 28687]AMM13916.1 TetR family transcriptional regulator [Burkholderia sp. PAMC 28687]
MARPKSDDKRNALLLAAEQVFAERGLAAPTSAISKQAGVAEGTLFTYFRTKDELVNALYRSIKLELADALMAQFPRRGPVRHRLEYLWNAFVDWGVANPQRLNVLDQLSVADIVTEESKAVGYEPFAEIEALALHSIKTEILQAYPCEFIAANMKALAETTMGFMNAYPDEAGRYRQIGFDVFWNGVARNKA